MEMHQVRYFLAAARTLNFTRAAEESNVSQPSLTRAIQKLEDEFGGQLFRRERSLTHLTELGRQMVPLLEQTYDAAQAAKRLAKGIGKDALAPITLGLAGGISVALQAAFADVSAALPGLQLRLVRDDSLVLIDGMFKGDIDAAILVQPRQVPERLDRIELVKQRFVVIAPRNCELAHVAEPTLEHLVTVRWIQGDADIADEFRKRCLAAGIDPEFRHRAAEETDLIELVASGLGCAILADSIALPETVVALRLASFEIARTVVFATVSGRKRSTATDALVRAVRARSWTAR